MNLNPMKNLTRKAEDLLLSLNVTGLLTCWPDGAWIYGGGNVTTESVAEELIAGKYIELVTNRQGVRVYRITKKGENYTFIL